jgi:glyoxylase-like metal-dependent hydrolase (beta-lactamase superfamily II)
MHRITRIAAAAMLSAAIGAGISANSAFAAQSTAQAKVEAAYKAEGNNDVKLAPQNIVALVVKGSMQAWDPGESDSVADPYKPDWGTSTFTESWDRSRGLYRVEWDRPRANGMRRVYTEIMTDEYGNKLGGYVMGIDVNGGQPARAIPNPANMQPMHTVSGVRLTAEMRELERNDVVEMANDNPDRVSDSPDVAEGGKTYKAFQYRGNYGTYIVLLDPATNLPAIVRTRDFDVHAGDANYDVTYSDWRAIGMAGVKYPFRQVTTINGTKIFDTTIQSVAFNPQIPVDAFTVPRALRGKADAPAPVDKIRNQWILRRLGNGFYADWNTYYTDEGGALKIEEIAPNISFVNGGSHNTLIVATSDGLIAFEAPGDDGQSKIVMDLAQAKYPGKTWKYLVLTHHHIDHTGGLRAFAAAGATIVVGKGNGDFFRKAITAPSTLNPYGTRAVANPQIIEVDGKWSVTEGGRTIEAYSLDTPHAAGYVIPYVPDAKIGFVTDIWSPAPMIPPANPGTISLVKGIQKMGIQMDRMAGGHGGVGNFADLAKTVQ